MPEMHVIVRWPDESLMTCYSPSLVIREYLEVGTTYALDDFVARSRTALSIASDRVRAKYGYACTLAARTLAQIEHKARAFEMTTDAGVRVESYRE